MNYQIIPPKDIEECQLFYNAQEKQQIDEIMNILIPTNYIKILRRLHHFKMKCGMVFLFWGDSGVGKTRLVYEIAKETDRDVVKSCYNRSRYVGESESQLRRLFEDYDNLVKQYKRAKKNQPILLFDEADSIFTKRSKVRHTSDVHENSLQDLLLELVSDNDNRIIFLTTNRLENMDNAFMRRILYKVKVTAPCQEVRSQIIHSLFPSLTEDEVASLSEYQMTGANWANVSQKANINHVIYGEDINIKSLSNYCLQEGSTTPKLQRIGFC